MDAINAIPFFGNFFIVFPLIRSLPGAFFEFAFAAIDDLTSIDVKGLICGDNCKGAFRKFLISSSSLSELEGGGLNTSAR